MKLEFTFEINCQIVKHYVIAGVSFLLSLFLFSFICSLCANSEFMLVLMFTIGIVIMAFIREKLEKYLTILIDNMIGG